MPLVEADHDQDAGLRRHLQQWRQGVEADGAALEVFTAVERAASDQAFGKGDQPRAFCSGLACQRGNLVDGQGRVTGHRVNLGYGDFHAVP
ncbi:hypothetical protein D3C79_1023100 [compost metagenome]